VNTSPQNTMTSFGQNWRQNWHMYRALVGIGTICGLIIVSVYLSTKPVIDFNRAAALEQAIFSVLPDTVEKRTYQYNTDGHFTLQTPITSTVEKRPLVHATYDKNHQLTGFALTAEGMGFQDTIELIYGYVPDKNAVVGFRVLASRETPGLGSKIESDKQFLENFKQLDVSLNVDHSALAHAVETVKSGKKTQPWQIDTITGATISSKAVGSILHHSTSKWIPLLRNNIEDFRRGEQTRHQ